MCTDLLPNLINLRATTFSWDPSTNSQVAVLLGRSLRTIKITPVDNDSVEDWTSALLGYLPSACPNIEEVKITDSRDLPSNLAQDLARCEKLRCFRSDAPVSIQTGMDFLQLHKLHELSLNISEGEDDCWKMSMGTDPQVNGPMKVAIVVWPGCKYLLNL